MSSNEISKFKKKQRKDAFQYNDLPQINSVVVYPVYFQLGVQKSKSTINVPDYKSIGKIEIVLRIYNRKGFRMKFPRDGGKSSISH